MQGGRVADGIWWIRGVPPDNRVRGMALGAKRDVSRGYLG